ncbi:ATP-binding protein [Leucobacter viscericola]|uniref:ATP-binding protein n=2 Tax=Leucobacter viscericola TaxID=2714935 RepID=A0A6G7XGL1_9MICO|nr:DUF4143 domain-containing protein [Leucobacter viscericola]QIK63642.1 ATP-binding protein [Leucobacter viscericola]
MDTKLTLGRTYQPRIIDSALQHALNSAGAVIIEGARASGKTMTAMHAAASYAFIDDAEVQLALDVAPAAVLEGRAPRLLDEWQLAPELWNLTRRAVDRADSTGRFILTGSAIPADDITRHTGAGRFIRLRQRTMTWSEKLDDATNRLSVAALFEGSRPTGDMSERIPLEALIENVLLPGFPAMKSFRPQQSAAQLRAYLDEVARTDVSRLVEVRHEPAIFRQLIAGLARSTASEVNYRTLASDVRTLAPTINAETISGYASILERLFIVEQQRAWSPKLRSRARLRTSSKLHLADPAFAAAALGAGPDQLARDLETLGLLFESAVVHDLMVFASALGGSVTHYRDSNGNEIDAIITLPDGRWGAVEVKLGGGQMNAGIASLKKAISQIDTQVVGEPSFTLVVTGTGGILTATDGTVVCPLHALAP